MIYNDMELKRRKAMQKVHDAIALHGGTTLLTTGISGDDARVARAAWDVGIKLFEPNHPAMALARGYKGVTNMHAAEQIRHEITLEQMAEATQGVRNVITEAGFITVGIPGGFTEVMPTELVAEDLDFIAHSGADGLHTHKSCLQDLEDLVKLAHRYGLTVDAYINHPDDLHAFGIPARTGEEVAKVAKSMESIGVDMIGLMTGMSYEGMAAHEIPNAIKERLLAVVESVSVPTLAEGGINTANYKAFAGTGVKILVVGTAIDDIIRKVTQETVLKFIGQ